MKRSTLSVAAMVGLVAVGAMVASSAARNKSEAPKVGQMAPVFNLPNQDGKPVSLTDYKGKIVVLEWFNDGCPFVQRHYKLGTMKSLAEKYKDNGVVWLAINSTSDATAEGNKKWIDEHGLSYPILSDNDGNVGHMYDAKNTPEMYIVDKNGVLAYMGGIDNQPTDSGPVNPDTVNYVDKALGELIHGQSVSVSESQPYGCHVHYK